MSNDSKLGLLAGVAVVLVVAVFFYPKSGLGPATIPGSRPVAGSSDGPPGQPPAQTAAPSGTVPTAEGIWKFSAPRTKTPVSKDPLTWPQN
ncbi:MAG TPA: hypothetical protein VGJ05_10130 [Fimbriiglobus sp.]|jgi:hypothetical protein